MPWLAQVRERNQGTDWAAGRWEDSTESLENDLHNYSLIWRLESFPVRSDVFWIMFWLRINVESFSGSPREDSVMITFIWYYSFSLILKFMGQRKLTGNMQFLGQRCGERAVRMPAPRMNWLSAAGSLAHPHISSFPLNGRNCRQG